MAYLLLQNIQNTSLKHSKHFEANLQRYNSFIFFFIRNCVVIDLDHLYESVKYCYLPV